MKRRAICKRCHRFRVVGETGHCVYCVGDLRAMEKPKARPPTDVPSPEKKEPSL